MRRTRLRIESQRCVEIRVRRRESRPPTMLEDAAIDIGRGAVRRASASHCERGMCTRDGSRVRDFVRLPPGSSR